MSQDYFVGREIEINQLQNYYEEASKGLGKIILVNGITGCGKSSLIYQFLKKIEFDNNHTTYIIECCKKEKLEAYNAFNQIISSSKSEINFENISSESDIISYFDTKLRNLTSNTLVLFFDNIQYSDTSSLKLFYSLAKSLRQKPYKVMVIACFNIKDVILEKYNTKENNLINLNSFSSILNDIRSLTKKESYVLRNDNWILEITIEPLKLADIASLLNLRFENNEFPSNFSNIIYSISRGYAIFIENIIEYLIQRKEIYLDNKIWKIKNNNELQSITTLNNLITKRILYFEKSINKIESQPNINSSKIINILSPFEQNLCKSLCNEFGYKENISSKNSNDIYLILNKIKQICNILVSENNKIINEYLLLINKYIIEHDQNLKTNIDIYTSSNNSTNLTEHELISEIEKLLKIAKEYRDNFAMHETIKITIQAKNIIQNFSTKSKQIIKLQYKLLQIKNEALDWLGYYHEALDCAKQMLDISNLENSNKHIAYSYFRIGDEYSHLSQYQESIDNISLAISMAEKNSDNKALTTYYNTIGQVYFHKSDFTTAKKYFHKSLKLNQELTNQIFEAETLLNLGNVERMNGNFEEAINNFNNAMLIFEAKGKKNQIAKVYSQIGLTLNSKGDLIESEKYFQKALNIDIEIGDRINMANRYNNIGLVKSDLGEYQNAIEYYLKALQIDESLNDLPKMAISFNNIGIAMLASNQNEIAENYFEKALEIYIQLNNETDIAFTYSNFGNLYFQNGDIDKAIKYYKKALEIDLSKKDKLSIMTDYNNIGNLYCSLSQYHQALEYFNQSLNIAIKTKDELSQAGLYNNFGNIYYAQKDYTKAQEYYIKALKINTKKGDKASIALNYANLANIYRVEDKIKRSETYYIKAIDINKSLGDNCQLVNNLETLANIYLEDYQHTKAKATFLEAADIYEKQNNQRQMAICLKNATKPIIYNEDEENAKSILYKVLDIFKELEDKPNIAETEILLGKIYCYQKDYIEANKHLKRAAIIYSEIENIEEYCENISEIAQLFSRMENKEEALVYYHQLVDIYYSNNKKNNIPYLYNTIASYYKDNNDIKTAEEYYLKAATLNKELEKNYEYASNLSKAITCYDNIDNEKIIKELPDVIDLMLKEIEKKSNDSEKLFIRREVIPLLLTLADKYLEKKLYDNSLLYYKKAADMCKFVVKIINYDYRHVGFAYNNIGYIFDIKCNYQKAIEYYQQALIAYKKTVCEDEAIVNNSKNIALMYEHLYSFNIAAIKYENLYSIYYDNFKNIPIGEIACLTAESIIKSNGDIYIAKQYFNFAYDEFVKENNILGMVQAIQGKSLIYIELNNENKISECIKKLTKIINKSDDLEIKIETLSTIGYIYFINNDIENSIKNYEEAIVLSLNNDKWNITSSIYFDMASLFYSECKNLQDNITFNNNKYTYYELIQDLFNRSINIATTDNNIELIVNALNSLANLQLRLFNIDEAISLLDKAVEISTKSNDIKSIISAQINKCDVATRYLKDFVMAENCILHAINLSEKIDLYELKNSVYSQYFIMLVESNRLTEAHNIYIKYKNIFSNFINSNSELRNRIIKLLNNN
ncbi:MAG: tetratricopeptide repeat protein [Bacteroidales bacterium]|nr:tetratricopeptide repeat protein [Bacteroidales bacterium]